MNMEFQAIQVILRKPLWRRFLHHHCIRKKSGSGFDPAWFYVCICLLVFFFYRKNLMPKNRENWYYGIVLSVVRFLWYYLYCAHHDFCNRDTISGSIGNDFVD